MSTGTMCIVNPLPQQYLTQGKGTGGVIKSQPADFVVEEIPLYEPCGEGEHLYLRIEKTNVSHGELMSCLRKHFHVKEVNIGYAGMKDKAAVTRQTVSIHLLEDPPSVEIDHERINVLWARRHTNKIRRGHLRGNRFSIRIREVDPLSITAVKRCLDQLQQTGMPNYFGVQRFGYRCNNHRLGLLLLHHLSALWVLVHIFFSASISFFAIARAADTRPLSDLISSTRRSMRRSSSA